MALIYLVQHAQKQPTAGDPGLTATGRTQAGRVAQWLSTKGITAVYCSSLLRSQQTAAPIAAAIGVTPVLDDRLRERMNWDGGQPIDEFLADWSRATQDRGWVPRSGDSSRQAAARLIAFLDAHADHAGPVAAVTHGGITVDALRSLVSDVPGSLLRDGVPSCAVTTFDGRTLLSLPTLH